MHITKAMYIKLGESGIWEKDSIENHKIRFGWKNIPAQLINDSNWEAIKKLIDDNYLTRGKKSGATNDFNALHNICHADEETVFITFYMKLHTIDSRMVL